MDLSISLRNEHTSPLLRLPTELRLQIYGYVIGCRTVHIRINWTGMCNPSGFKYACLEDPKHLLQHGETRILEHAVPFGPDLHGLVRTCRQMRKDTACLPFTSFTWAFENAFTLEQWVSTKSFIPVQHKYAIRTVAVPTPGPYRSSERRLSNLREIVLIGFCNPSDGSFSSDPRLGTAPLAMISLKKDKASGAWMRGSEPAQYAKDLFEQA
jgi:hypothetical protein